MEEEEIVIKLNGTKSQNNYFNSQINNISVLQNNVDNAGTITSIHQK